jgi:hypothetical protein
MKKLIAFCLLLAALGTSQAATRIEVWIAITNNPAYLTNTLTWNSLSNRVWTSTVASASSQIMATNTIQNARTNLKVNLDTYKFRNWHTIQYGTNTNDVVLLVGTNEAVTVAIGGLWATVTYKTNTVYSADFIKMPPQTTTSNTFYNWILTSLMTNLQLMVTQEVGAVGVAFTNFPHRYRAANPPMTNMSVYGGTNQPNDFLGTNGGLRNMWASNLTVTNLTGDSTNLTLKGGWASNLTLIGIATMSGTFGNMTNGTLQGTKLTNAIAHITNGYMSNVIGHTITITNLDAPGSGTASQRLGSGSTASGAQSIAIGVNANSGASGTVAVGYGAIATNNSDIAIGVDAIAKGSSSIAIGGEARSTNSAVALGASAIALYAQSVAIGPTAEATTNSQIRLGISSSHVSIPGIVLGANMTNTTFLGTNNWEGDWAFGTIAEYDGLVDRPGVNQNIPIGNTVYKDLSGASAISDIHGFESNRVGLVFYIIVSGSVSNVLIHNSGSVSDTTLRLNTGTGGDIVQTNQPAWAKFRRRATDYLLMEYSR